MDGITGIIKFQKDRNLDKQEYNEVNEQINILEEVLEAGGFDIPKENRKKLINYFNTFAELLKTENISINTNNLEVDDIVDAYGDIIVFAVGAIMKLRYDPKLVLKEISKEINSRKGRIINGKFEKYLPNEPGYEKPYKANFKTCKTSK